MSSSSSSSSSSGLLMAVAATVGAVAGLAFSYAFFQPSAHAASSPHPHRQPHRPPPHPPARRVPSRKKTDSKNNNDKSHTLASPHNARNSSFSTPASSSATVEQLHDFAPLDDSSSSLPSSLSSSLSSSSSSLSGSIGATGDKDGSENPYQPDSEFSSDSELDDLSEADFMRLAQHLHTAVIMDQNQQLHHIHDNNNDANRTHHHHHHHHHHNDDHEHEGEIWNRASVFGWARQRLESLLLQHDTVLTPPSISPSTPPTFDDKIPTQTTSSSVTADSTAAVTSTQVQSSIPATANETLDFTASSTSVSTTTPKMTTTNAHEVTSTPLDSTSLLLSSTLTVRRPPRIYGIHGDILAMVTNITVDGEANIRAPSSFSSSSKQTALLHFNFDIRLHWYAFTRVAIIHAIRAAGLTLIQLHDHHHHQLLSLLRQDDNLFHLLEQALSQLSSSSSSSISASSPSPYLNVPICYEGSCLIKSFEMSNSSVPSFSASPSLAQRKLDDIVERLPLYVHLCATPHIQRSNDADHTQPQSHTLTDNESEAARRENEAHQAVRAIQAAEPLIKQQLKTFINDFQALEVNFK